MRRFLPALALLPLPALATAAAPADPPAYRALGTEPFWNLTIDDRAIRLEEVGRRPVMIARARVLSGPDGSRYRAPGMTIDVRRERCSDGMSDRVYPDTVTVRLGARTLRGCGLGRAAADTRLSGTKWTVDLVNGRPIQTYAPLTVTFTADRIGGKLCNSFGGSYTLAGQRLRAGPIMATKMMCRGPAMIAESTLFAMLGGPVTATVASDGALTLDSGRDTVRLRPDRR